MGGFIQRYVLPSLAPEDGYDPWGQCNNSWGWCTDPQCGTQGAAIGRLEKWCVGWHHGHLNFLHSPWKKLPSQRGNYSSQPSFSKGLCQTLGGVKLQVVASIFHLTGASRFAHRAPGTGWSQGWAFGRAGNHRVGQLSQLSQKIDLDGGSTVSPGKNDCKQQILVQFQWDPGTGSMFVFIPSLSSSVNVHAEQKL